jgi:phytoene/squalene synthetase
MQMAMLSQSSSAMCADCICHFDQAMTKQSRDEVFKAVQTEHENFKLALGNLMLSWADAESALYCVLRHYAGVSDDVARAVFSGTRAKGMIEFINNIGHNTNMDSARRNDLAIVFSHMSAINTMRDRLVHNSSAGEIRFEMDDPGSR